MNRQPNRLPELIRTLQRVPAAGAELRGSSDYPSISGRVFFYPTERGVLVAAQVYGLPVAVSPCKGRIFAFHIHSGATCTGNQNDAFADTKSHYNPGGCEHPYHAGDLPPLWGNDGYAVQIFLTDRFSVSEIIGKTVVIHGGLDDFTTQPSGNAGAKIACGIIARYGT